MSGVLDSLLPLLSDASAALYHALWGLLAPAAAFSSLAVLVKGRRVFAGIWQVLSETRINLLIACFNAVLMAPLFSLLFVWMNTRFQDDAPYQLSSSVWDGMPIVLVVLAAVFAGDFAGYWRHRLEHTRLLWPAHAVHHSDTRMTWLTLERFHPINSFTTLVLDNTFLLLLGFPPYALVANNLVRHYYGYLIHADLPWTYGKLGAVFVSPAMHRWHHADDADAFDTNYATVFSIFDRWFGTLRVPGPCVAALGVKADMGPGAVGQLTYPLRPSLYRHPAGRIIRRVRRVCKLPV